MCLDRTMSLQSYFSTYDLHLEVMIRHILAFQKRLTTLIKSANNKNVLADKNDEIFLKCNEYKEGSMTPDLYNIGVNM